MWSVLISLFCLPHSYAGKVRTLYTNDRVMQPVFLAMGRSTVLRFDEKPRNTVIGNQNYFNVEFIGNDITIQPQGTVTTNLFVYTEFQTYGLIIKVGGNVEYDDFVYVKWKPGYVSIVNETKKKTDLLNSKVINQKLEIKGELRVLFKKCIQNFGQGLTVLELEVENLRADALKTEEVQIVLNMNKVKVDQKVVFKDEIVSPHKRVDARVLTRTQKIEGIEFTVSYKNKSSKMSLPKRFIN